MATLSVLIPSRLQPEVDQGPSLIPISPQDAGRLNGKQSLKGKAHRMRLSEVVSCFLCAKPPVVLRLKTSLEGGVKDEDKELVWL